jgi:hypothetical protein
MGTLERMGIAIPFVLNLSLKMDIDREVVWVRLANGRIVPRAPDEVIALEHGHYFTSPQWTHTTFRAWLAGFLDHAGRIRSGTLEVSGREKDASLLFGIRDRLSVGAVESARVGGKSRFVWRVKARREVADVLTLVLPYLTTLQDEAAAALKRSTNDFTERDRQVLARWLAGAGYAEIARALKISHSVVKRIVERYREENDIRPLPG